MSWRSVALAVALAVIAAPCYASDWVFENVDPSDCSWVWDDSSGTGTLSCPAGDYVFSCGGGSGEGGGGGSDVGGDGGGRSGVGGDGGGGSAGDGSTGSSGIIGFKLARLNRAKMEAQIKLERPSCRNLWPSNGLNGNGQAAISLTNYRAGGMVGTCSAVNVRAYTSVNSFSVTLCDTFFLRISDYDRVMTTIHEAMHSSGMNEWPNGLYSWQISQMVELACPC